MSHFKFRITGKIRRPWEEAKARAKDGFGYEQSRYKELDMLITCNEEDADIIRNALASVSVGSITLERLNRVAVVEDHLAN